jgi:Zn-dependent M28 family amino/carboxypeptidase
MKKSGGFFFAIAAIAISIIIWGNPISRLLAAFSAPPAATSPLSLSRSAADLGVDEANLIAHVQAIAQQPRDNPGQKEITRRYISEQLARYGIAAQPQQYGLDTQLETGVESGTNLVATIPGSDPTAGSILLGAHYDTHVGSPGADDNGSAIATLLETARIFSAQAQALQANGAAPAPKSLTLVFFDQEEQQIDGSGLLGSLAFTQQPSNLTHVQGAIILDMLGYACHTPGCQTYPPHLPVPNLPETGDFLAVLGLQDDSSLLSAFTLSAQSSAPTVLSLPVPKPMINLFPDLLRSDHAPFWDKGVPAVFVSDTANFRNPNYHQPGDTIDTIDPAFFKGSAQHVVNAIAALINQTS